MQQKVFTTYFQTDFWRLATSCYLDSSLSLPEKPLTSDVLPVWDEDFDKGTRLRTFNIDKFAFSFVDLLTLASSSVSVSTLSSLFNSNLSFSIERCETFAEKTRRM